MDKKLDTSIMRWINKPLTYLVHRDYVIINSVSHTDMWQKTYYNVEKCNAPALLLYTKQNFTFRVKVEANYQNKYDQVGILIYVDDQNWIKVGIEYHNDSYSFLSTVVTIDGRSDWSTSKMSSDIHFMYYRLSHRNGEFKIENSLDGENYRQMRIFNFYSEDKFGVGIYVSSPLDSNFDATFSNMYIGKCIWEPYNRILSKKE